MQDMFTGETVNELMDLAKRVDPFDAVKSINEARQLIQEVRLKIASGPMYPWARMLHAEDYLDKQISELYRGYFEVSE